jgi:hypothetical protein
MHRSSVEPQPNNLLDASGGGVFLILLGAARDVFIPAASTQTFSRFIDLDLAAFAA